MSPKSNSRPNQRTQADFGGLIGGEGMSGDTLSKGFWCDSVARQSPGWIWLWSWQRFSHYPGTTSRVPWESSMDTQPFFASTSRASKIWRGENCLLRSFQEYTFATK